MNDSNHLAGRGFGRGLGPPPTSNCDGRHRMVLKCIPAAVQAAKLLSASCWNHTTQRAVPEQLQRRVTRPPDRATPSHGPFRGPRHRCARRPPCGPAATPAPPAAGRRPGHSPWLDRFRFPIRKKALRAASIAWRAWPAWPRPGRWSAWPGLADERHSPTEGEQRRPGRA